jgi:hypothetical protein
MRNKVRIQRWIHRDLDRRARSLAAANDVTDSAVIEAALADYLDPDRVDRDWLVRRLDLLNLAVAHAHASFERANARAERDMDLLFDAFGVFVRYFFLHATTKVGADQEQIMEATYQRFLRLVRDANRQSGWLRREPQSPDSPAAGGRAAGPNVGGR